MKTSFYSELSCTSQFKVLNTLLKMLLSTASVVEATAIRVVLRSINVSAVNMAHFLTSFCSEIDLVEVRYKFECPAGICLFKVNNGNIILMCGITKLIIKTLERRHLSRSGVFIVNIEQISHNVLVFRSLRLN